MIIATAGHVDHGKTALVKALSGVDTDRLDAEKQRGLTIDLGFAYRAHPQRPERVTGFIDVPGHQRFINTMISGITGIDLGMLVVAADDGIMPQTQEHLDILRLLGIRDCIGVVTKTDRVSDDRVVEVSSTVTTLLANRLGITPVVFQVSNTSGEGIGRLSDWLDARLLEQPSPDDAGIFRLGVDRVFTLKGVGLVVTGTILSGRVSVDDTVRLLPSGKSIRVRSLHAQDRQVECAVRGQRCAVNLAGDVTREDVKKGHWLVGAECGEPTNCFTATVSCHESPVKLRHRMQVKLYLGAAHVPAKIGFIESRPDLLQVQTNEPVSCCHGDAFLLRDYSETFLLGGGRVLDPWAESDRKAGAKRLAYLDALATGGFVEALGELVSRGGQVIEFDRYRCTWNLDSATAQSLLVKAGMMEALSFLESGHVVTTERWQALQQSLLDMLEKWHRQHPDQRGMPLDQFEVADGDTALLPALVDSLQKDGHAGKKLVMANGRVSLAGFDQAMPEKTQRLWQRVETILRKQGLEIPLLSEIEKQTGVRGREMNFLVTSALKSGKLVRINAKRVGLPETLNALSDQVVALGKKKPRFTVIDFRDWMGTGRNYAIEILDYLDTVGFTRRDGNERMVIDHSVPEKLFG